MIQSRGVAQGGSPGGVARGFSQRGQPRGGAQGEGEIAREVVQESSLGGSLESCLAMLGLIKLG